MAAKVYWGLEAWQADKDNPAEPGLLLLGDSWFWYPFNDLANEIGAQLNDIDCLLVIGRNGAEAQQWSQGRLSNDIDRAFGYFGASVKGLLLSGGGDDIAGVDNLDAILAADCSKAKAAGECYALGQPDAALSKIESAYREVIVRFRKYNLMAPVVCHNYEYAWPTGKGVFGPADWLKIPFDDAHVPDNVVLRRALLHDLLDRLHDRQQDLVSDPGTGPLLAIKTAGTLPDSLDVWANELHLTPDGFREMVKLAWMPVLGAAGIR